MASQSLHAGNTLGEINVTPHQENQRVCTRSSPCLQQGCLLCYAPPSHVRNLDVDLNSSNASSSSPSKPLPQPPDDHPIALLTFAFQNAIQTNDIDELEAVTHLYTNSLNTNLDFIKYDRSTLNSLRLAAKKLLTSHIAVNTPLPSTPPNRQTSDQHNPTYPACFKPPKITTDTWNGQSYDFYPWLASVLNGFELTGCPDRAKLTLTLQAIPTDKKGPLNNITDWDEFKIKLVDEYGSIDVFGREVNQIFDLLPYYETVQEIAEDLSPKIKKLQSNLLIIQQFHDVEDLNSVALTQHLIHNIMRRIPKEVKGDFNKQYMKFRNKSAANVRPPASFAFIARFVNELAKNYRSNPDLYDSEYASPSLGVKLVRQGSPNISNKSPPHPQINPNISPKRPCTLCSGKGFQNDHFPLNQHCGVAKLSSKDILRLIDKLQACSTCTHTHDPTYKCKTTFHSGVSKVCTTGCLHNGLPLHRNACKHKDQAPSITVSKVSTNKSVPLVENIPVGNTHIGIQYDTGCQLSLISQSTLSTIPKSMYTLGTSSKVTLTTYAGEGKTILTTEVKLRLYGKILKLSVIQDDLNNGAGFTLSVPSKWRSITGNSTSHHNGKISILIGGDNHLFFPTEIERDSQGMALYQSNLTQRYMVYGSVPSNTITWVEPLISYFNRTKKFRKTTRQSRKETGGESDTSVRKQGKNDQVNRKRNRRRIQNFRKKSGKEPGQLGGEAGETSGTSGREQKEIQEGQDKNQSNRKRNRNFRNKSGEDPGKSGRETDTPISPEPPTNPNPTIESDPPTSPEPQTNPNHPVESGNPGKDSGERSETRKLAPEPSKIKIYQNRSSTTPTISNKENHNRPLS